MLTTIEFLVLNRQLPLSLRNMDALEGLWLCIPYPGQQNRSKYLLASSADSLMEDGSIDIVALCHH